jgi:PAS domain-containing protein
MAMSQIKQDIIIAGGDSLAPQCETLMDTSRSGVIQTGQDGEIVQPNRFAEEPSGYARNEFIGKKLE